MAVRVGIDLATGSPHRVVIERRLGSVQVLPPETQGPGTVALPTAILTFRSLSMPFSDRRRLDGLVEQELASSLAFPLASTTWDYTIAPESAAGEPNVFAVACPTERLQQSLQPLAGQPARIDAEPFAFQRVLLLAGVRDALVVDVGSERTLLCRVRRGSIDFVRVLVQGTRTLAHRAAAALGVDEATAARRVAAEGTQLGTVTDAVELWVREALLPETPSDIPAYVAGSGGPIPGLAQALGRALGRSCQPLPMPEGLSPWSDAIALGMALADLRQSQGVDLQKQEPARRPVHVEVALWLALVAALWTADLVGQSWSVRGQLASYDEAILAIANKAAPGAGIRSMAVQRLQSLLAQRGGTPSSSGRTPVSVLEAASEAVAKARQESGPLKVFDVRLDGHELRLQGEAASFKQIESLHRGLEGLGKVAEESTRAGGSSGTFSYTLRVQLEAP